MLYIFRVLNSRASNATLSSQASSANININVKNNLSSNPASVVSAPGMISNNTPSSTHQLQPQQQLQQQQAAGARTSPSLDDKSPNVNMNRQASPSGPEDNEDEEDGAHDTITSLAGVKMLQKYKFTSYRGSASSLQQHRLEDLFLIEEDAKDTDEDVQRDHAGQDQQEHKDLTEPLVGQEAKAGDGEDDVIDLDIFVPPDGGYGWLVTMGAFNALFWTAGMIKSYGVIFDLILTTFPTASVSLAAWIPAAMTTLALALAPVASALCQRFNCRSVTLVGSLLCFVGISLSSLAKNVETLFVTFGLLTGLGVGLSTTPGIILVAR